MKGVQWRGENHEQEEEDITEYKLGVQGGEFPV